MVPCSLIDKLLELRQTGSTVLDCSLALSVGTADPTNYRFKSRYCNARGSVLKGMNYPRAEGEWLLTKIAPFVKESHIHESEPSWF